MVDQAKIEESEQEAAAIAASVFGVRVSAQRLPGERDLNFCLSAVSEGEMSRPARQALLKLSHREEDREILLLQNQVLNFLNTTLDTSVKITLPQLLKSQKEEEVVAVQTREGVTRWARMFTYLPGKTLATAKPHAADLLKSIGRSLGAIDRALLSFSHPAAERVLKWDLKQASWISDHLSASVSAPLSAPLSAPIFEIQDHQRRERVGKLLTLYQKEVQPRWSELRKGVIHGDANDHNILVGRSLPSNRLEMTGLIDFGDVVLSHPVCELAIAMAYSMMNQEDPLAAGVQVVSGYHQTLPLTEPEVEVLFPLICARLCVSVVNSALEKKKNPQNTYLAVSEEPAWKLLEKLEKIPKKMAYTRFRDACGWSSHPDTPRLVKWLKENPDQVGSPVRYDLKKEPNHVFDLSPGSPEIGSEFPQLKSQGIRIGIGKYNEARLVYQSDAYLIQGNDSPEWRTVHLGMDLSLEAGEEVLAPLEGVVHSFRNNSAPFDYGPTVILEHKVGQGLRFFTLYGHLSLESLSGLSKGMKIKKGMPIARIGDSTVNGGWPPHLHFQLMMDLFEREGEFPGVARPSERSFWLGICPDPNLILQLPEKGLKDPHLSAPEILDLRSRHVGKSLSISYQAPLQIVRGTMQYLYDAEGRRYLDTVNNVSHVGHCHPKVVKAGQKQMAILNTNTRYLNENLARYAERLCSLLPSSLSVCYFVCSGSEANELAVRLARAHTRRKDVVVMEGSYHGNTSTLIGMSPYKYRGPGGAGAPSWVHEVPCPNVYRGRGLESRMQTSEWNSLQQAGKAYAAFVESAVQRQPGLTAAFICEALPSCGGQLVLPEGYLSEAYQSVRKAGGVCIADEVQVGFGRVGSHFWGFETQGVVPDIVTLGKPIGNGHPLAAVITTPEIAESFANGMEYFNTFGGNPVSCAIGMAVLDVIEEEGLRENALTVGNHLMERLSDLQKDHPLIGDVRGLGLFIGVELVLSRETLEPAALETSYIVNRMRERGILMSSDGPYHNVLKIKPPLVFNRANVDALVKNLDEILGEDLACAPVEGGIGF